MTQVFGITPAWGLPCISPFVTKVVYALRLKKIDFTLERQNLHTVVTDSPTGKLPYVILAEGDRIADSNSILAHLARDAHLTPEQAAMATALGRMLDEHTYWHVAVEPRWVDDDGWKRYRCTLFGVDPFPSELEAAGEHVRQAILSQWRGCGLGRMSEAQRSERAAEDVRTLATLLPPERFFFGDEPSNIDGSIAAMTAHMLKAPFPSPAAREAARHPILERHLRLVEQRIA